MAFQANFGGGVCGGGPFPSEACMDSFVTEVNEKGSALVYSTYLGGSGHDFGNGIGIDSEGKVFVAGGTTSPDFPTTPGAFDTTCGADGSCDTGSPFVGGMWDAYVTKLSATGSALLYSTYVGIEQGRTCRSEEHTSELQSLAYLVCRLLLENKKNVVL